MFRLKFKAGSEWVVSRDVAMRMLSTGAIVGSAMDAAVDELRAHSVLFSCEGTFEEVLIKRRRRPWQMGDVPGLSGLGHNP